MSNSSATRANYFNHECQNHTKCACRLLRFLPDFHFSICKMLFHLFLPGLCCMNNEAQCPSGVPPTPCSDSMLMTPERNTSQSRPSFRYCGKNLWQSRINIPSNLFRHLSNYRVECILKEQLAEFYEPVWCQRVNWGYTARELQSLSLSPGWRSPNTHTLETWRPIVATQVILE